MTLMAEEPLFDALNIRRLWPLCDSGSGSGAGHWQPNPVILAACQLSFSINLLV